MDTQKHTAGITSRVVPIIFTAVFIGSFAVPSMVLGADPAANATRQGDDLWRDLYQREQKPRSPGSMDAGVQFKLERAHTVALQRVVEVEECGNLFADFDTDGLERLFKTIYIQANPGQEHDVCRLGAAAWTAVGRPHTTLCTRFSRMKTDRAAIILIHEALHYAGMTEKPHDPSSMTSAQINRLVSDRCGL
jgi:hypothetical protein